MYSALRVSYITKPTSPKTGPTIGTQKSAEKMTFKRPQAIVVPGKGTRSAGSNNIIRILLSNKIAFAALYSRFSRNAMLYLKNQGKHCENGPYDGDEGQPGENDL